MTTSSENIKLWMSQIEPDYFMQFIRAWIPFNAWYVQAYPDLKKNDKDIIKALQDNLDSKPKEIIKILIGNIDKENHEALKFQSHFAELHFQLEKTPVNHNGKKLSFRNLSLTENPKKHSNTVDTKGNVYKVEKNSGGYFQAYIQSKGGKVLLDFKKPNYDIEELTKDNSFIRLEKPIQNKIKKLFEEINPKKPICIISDSSVKNDFILFKSKNSCKIIKDIDTVSKGCIKVLYSLRCMLFHGEIAPTENNKKIYENAFYLIQQIINELK